MIDEAWLQRLRSNASGRLEDRFAGHLGVGGWYKKWLAPPRGLSHPSHNAHLINNADCKEILRLLGEPEMPA